jgi:hypothetical protein
MLAGGRLTMEGGEMTVAAQLPGVKATNCGPGLCSGTGLALAAAVIRIRIAAEIKNVR